MTQTKKIYLDYAASTPVDPAVFGAMKPYFSEKFGNPGSLHGFGQEAIAAVDASRETIAKAIGADFREIVFTASATEANNLALRGVVQGCKWQIANSQLAGGENHSPFAMRHSRIIISSIEHESVLETARDLEKEGIEIVYIPINRAGIVDVKKIKERLTENTVLVSVMHANNEIGTVQPIAEISKIVRDFRGQMANSKWQIANGKSPSPLALRHWPLLHTDAAQSFQFLSCDVNDLGVDLMTLSAHKIYGPKGVGALYVRQMANGKWQMAKRHDKPFAIRHSPFAPLMAGGGQEFGLRSGTENVPAIVGFAKAAENLFSNSQEHWNEKISNLRDYLWKGIKKTCPKAETNGGMRYELGAKNSYLISHSSCLPNLLNVYFPNHDAQDLLTRFDLDGLAVSSGSACRSRAMESSYVIQALGYSRTPLENRPQGVAGDFRARDEISRGGILESPDEGISARSRPLAESSKRMSDMRFERANQRGTKSPQDPRTLPPESIFERGSLERAKSSIRFSLGRPTTKGEIDEALKILKKVLR